jgi:hypothetical protein
MCSMLAAPQRMPVRLLVALSIAVGLYVALRIYPSDLTAPQPHADFIATIFQSRVLIFTGRITLLVVAAFIVLSIVARIWNRQWLSKAGPFEISTAMTDVERERDGLSDELMSARATIRELKARIETRDELELREGGADGDD